jgi:hypothetical protein
MNNPYFASRNHAIFSSCDAGAGSGDGSGTNAGAFDADATEQQLSHDIGLVEQPSMQAATSDKAIRSVNGEFNFVFMRMTMVQLSGSMWNARIMARTRQKVSPPFVLDGGLLKKNGAEFFRAMHVLIVAASRQSAANFPRQILAALFRVAATVHA